MAQTFSPTLNDASISKSLGATRFAALPAERRALIEAYQILHVAFVVAPLVAGLDKFFNALVNWEKYLAPAATQITGLMPTTFMHLVGVVEIVAAIGIALRPKIFSYVVAAWLAAIIINLLLVGNYFDVALRDLGLMLGALALGRLSIPYEQRKSI